MSTQQNSCKCNMWCPEQQQCGCPQMPVTHCAGPYIYTGDSNIGSRQCCEGLKKCADRYGRQWCSTDGTCPGKGVKLQDPSYCYYSYENFTLSNSDGIA